MFRRKDQKRQRQAKLTKFFGAETSQSSDDVWKSPKRSESSAWYSKTKQSKGNRSVSDFSQSTVSMKKVDPLSFKPRGNVDSKRIATAQNTKQNGLVKPLTTKQHSFIDLCSDDSDNDIFVPTRKRKYTAQVVADNDLELEKAMKLSVLQGTKDAKQRSEKSSAIASVTSEAAVAGDDLDLDDIFNNADFDQFDADVETARRESLQLKTPLAPCLGADRPSTSGLNLNGQFQNKQSDAKKPAVAVEGGDGIPDFDTGAGQTWFYPINKEKRIYQQEIVKRALYENVLVSLPTGLGKTFIAAVVMYNFYRWYPGGKVVFLAPTKPLVQQQIRACYEVMGIPRDHMAQLTGNTLPERRAEEWKRCRVFFLTPQTMENDLARGACCAEAVRCVVVDEAHKATGQHAYCQVVHRLLAPPARFRLLALTATPGSDLKAVQQVITNLLISNLQLRTEQSLEIAPYLPGRHIEKHVVPFSPELRALVVLFEKGLKWYLEKLKGFGVIYDTDVERYSKFRLMQLGHSYANNSNFIRGKEQHNCIKWYFAFLQSMYHAYDLLCRHGIRAFYASLKQTFSTKARYGVELQRNDHLRTLWETVEERFGAMANVSLNATRWSLGAPLAEHPTDEVDTAAAMASHPKLTILKDILIEHFRNAEEETRAMVFTSFRNSVSEIVDLLKRFRPTLKPAEFKGHSPAAAPKKKKAPRGRPPNPKPPHDSDVHKASKTPANRNTQKKQQQTVRDFLDGTFNVLVSTCVGEEGLDFGEVDLIVCFDMSASPIRLVQRMGRTGRRRRGRAIILVSEGKENRAYHQSLHNRKQVGEVIARSNLLTFYAASPRMIPAGLHPARVDVLLAPQQPFDAERDKPPTNRKTTPQKESDGKTAVRCRSMKEFMTRRTVDEQPESDNGAELRSEVAQQPKPMDDGAVSRQNWDLDASDFTDDFWFETGPQRKEVLENRTDIKLCTVNGQEDRTAIDTIDQNDIEATTSHKDVMMESVFAAVINGARSSVVRTPGKGTGTSAGSKITKEGLGKKEPKVNARKKKLERNASKTKQKNSCVDTQDQRFSPMIRREPAKLNLVATNNARGSAVQKEPDSLDFEDNSLLMAAEEIEGNADFDKVQEKPQRHNSNIKPLKGMCRVGIENACVSLADNELKSLDLENNFLAVAADDIKEMELDPASTLEEVADCLMDDVAAGLLGVECQGNQPDGDAKECGVDSDTEDDPLLSTLWEIDKLQQQEDDQRLASKNSPFQEASSNQSSGLALDQAVDFLMSRSDSGSLSARNQMNFDLKFNFSDPPTPPRSELPISSAVENCKKDEKFSGDLFSVSQDIIPPSPVMGKKRTVLNNPVWVTSHATTFKNEPNRLTEQFKTPEKLDRRLKSLEKSPSVSPIFG